MITLQRWAKALGGVVAGAQVLCPGPGHSPRDRSLNVTLSTTADDGFVVYRHAGDDRRACRDHVLARIGHTRPERRVPPVDKSAAARLLWDKARDPPQIVRDYHGLRGLVLPDGVAGRVVRFHRRCPWHGEGGLDLP